MNVSLFPPSHLIPPSTKACQTENVLERKSSFPPFLSLFPALKILNTQRIRILRNAPFYAFFLPLRPLFPKEFVPRKNLFVFRSFLYFLQPSLASDLRGLDEEWSQYPALMALFVRMKRSPPIIAKTPLVPSFCCRGFFTIGSVSHLFSFYPVFSFFRRRRSRKGFTPHALRSFFSLPPLGLPRNVLNHSRS